jgi:hypothetical protein
VQKEFGTAKKEAKKNIKKTVFYQLVFRNNLQVNKKSESFWTLPISPLFLLNHQVSWCKFPFGGPTLQISDPIVSKYDEIIDELHRFANFGLFLAKQGTFDRFLKYKPMLSEYSI